MQETQITAPKLCVDCVFHEIAGFPTTCRFYPKYKNIEFPQVRSSIIRPAFCRITKIVVYEEPPKETWG